ncbi:MAG: hypothetical protein K2X27_02985 [Candidatus Obscuribacterales bacterium]|nr:hypothetical protein [Candidatus Obscuribacterales bacterium]
MNEIDKAEYIQALKAYLIPTSMFIACLLGAAGTFLIREGYGVGWAVIAASAAMLVAAFVAFITFQNKLRANGQMVDQFDSPAPDYSQAEAAPAKSSCCEHNHGDAEEQPQKSGAAVAHTN